MPLHLLLQTGEHMSQPPNAKIRASRKILGNPYAYSDGEGGYDAILFQDSVDVNESRRLLENPYAYLDANGAFGEYIRPDHAAVPIPRELRSDDLLGGKKKGNRFSKREIEQVVRRLQIELWNERESIWPGRGKIAANEVLDPSVALRLLGYRVDMRDSLGQYSLGREIFEVAGTVDEVERQVQISRRFSPEIRNFTTAHELGHAILHQSTGLHRDRVQDGGSGGVPRDETEIEADIFAALFLMPSKVVRAAFKDRFLTDHFTIDEDTAFALGFDDLSSLEKKCRTIRDLVKVLAGADHYNGRFFTSLAQQFGVSIEAMAIRLEELDLASR